MKFSIGVDSFLFSAAILVGPVNAVNDGALIAGVDSQTSQLFLRGGVAAPVRDDTKTEKKNAIRKLDEGNCTSVSETICGMEDSKVFCEILSGNSELSTAVEESEFTIFVPTDQAFQDAESTLASLSGNEVKRIVEYHFHEGSMISYDDLNCTEKITMMSNSSNDLSRTKCIEGVKYQSGHGNTLSNRPKILVEDTTACNAIIHPLDHVMYPVILKEFGALDDSIEIHRSSDGENVDEAQDADEGQDADEAQETDETDCPTISETICGMEDSKVFCEMLTSNPELSTAVEESEFTIFVPTDQAFQDAESTLAFMSAQEVTQVIQFHFYEGSMISYDELNCTEKLIMMSDFTTNKSRTKCVDGEKYQNGIGNTKSGSLPKILLEEKTACNAIIHPLDHIMYPVYPEELFDRDDESEDDEGAEVDEDPDGILDEGNCTSVSETICGMGDSKVFCEILTNITAETPGLSTAIAESEFTIFVPTDQAFADAESTLTLLSDEEVTRIIAFHFHEGSMISYDALNCTDKIIMMSDFSTDLSRTSCKDGAKYQKGNGNTKSGSLPKVLSEEETACNAIIHPLDHIMYPVHLSKIG